MHAHQCADAAAFLDATLAYRDLEPLRTNVLGSVASAAAIGEIPRAEVFWWVVRDDDERVVGAAMRTAPFALSLGPMAANCAAVLAGSVAAVDADLPAVAGFPVAVEAFLAAFAATGPVAAARTRLESHRQVLYTAAAVEVPAVPGDLSVATEAELELAEQWYLEFTAEVDGVRVSPNAVDRAMLAATVRSGRLRWWRDGGAIVSMAGHALPVATPGGVVTRVGPVYTPPPSRARGYAAALTGRLTERLLASGSAVMLYADAANATSNGVYVRLGYTPVDELVRTPLSASS
jgi:GNAT superfamily N-acetyltransferase